MEKDSEESWEIGDRTFGVEGTLLTEIFVGVGTASASGANWEYDDKESGKMKVAKARCCAFWSPSDLILERDCPIADLVVLL